MNLFGTKAPMLDRGTALSGHPVQLPASQREVKDGKLHVTIEFRRPGWQRVMGADAICDRTFALDDYGREVYEACDGKTNVSQLVNRFAKNHSITVAESEVAIASFLKTLMRRGMIVMEMRDREQ